MLPRGRPARGDRGHPRAIACRATEGAPQKQARALTELTSYLDCRGFYSQAEAAVAEAEGLVADEPLSDAAAQGKALPFTPDLRQRPRCRASRSRGRRRGLLSSAETSRRPLEAARHASDRSSSVATSRSEIAILEARGVSSSRAAGLKQQAARALNNLGAARHEPIRPCAREPSSCLPRSSTALPTTSISGESTSSRCLARSQLDQGRWTDAAETATQLLRDPRESPWPQLEALRRARPRACTTRRPWRSRRSRRHIEGPDLARGDSRSRRSRRRLRRSRVARESLR